jgi:hypothetical protein
MAGYILLRRPAHPGASPSGRVYKHRLIAEIHLRRFLLPTEEVHHKDGNTKNNDWSNLEVCPSRAHHTFRHRRELSDLRRPGEENPEVRCGCGCGGVLPKFDERGRPRQFLPHHGRRIRATTR